MEQIASQLDAVRRRARRLLLWRRVFQFVMVAGPVAVALGWLDYLLRLPGWFRLIVGVLLLLIAAVWLTGRLRRAWAFAPSLSELALRAERMFPDLRGVLASGLELGPLKMAGGAAGALSGEGAVSRGLSSVVVEEAQKRSAGRNFGQLIDPRSTRKFAGAGLAGMAVLLVTVLTNPAAAKVAAQRWLLPLGETAWPKRVEVVPVDRPTVVAADTAAELNAQVQRGFRPGMRVWLQYHFEHETAGSPTWASAQRSVLMAPREDNEAGDGLGLDSPAGTDAQGSPLFAAQIEPPVELERRLDRLPDGARLVYTFEAGDDASAEVVVPVVSRPKLRGADATVTPPAYARAYLPAQQIELDAGSERLGTVTALEGSDVCVALEFNKPLAADQPPIITLFDGLPADALVTWNTSERAAVTGDDAETSNATLVRRVEVRYRLPDTGTWSILPRDRYGLTDSTPRRLRVVSTADAPPTVTLFEPANDLRVLPTAAVPVRAEAGDDVSLSRLVLLAEHPVHDVPTEDSDAETTANVELARAAEFSTQLDASVSLELASLKVRPGDVVTLSALAWDVFERDGVARDPVAAVPRRLTVIDAATLMSEVQRELAAVRRSAERLRAEQATLRRSEPAAVSDLAEPQSRITRGMTPPSQRLEAAQQRLALNGLSEPELDELLNRAGDLLEQAEATSRESQQNLANDADAQAQEQGRAQQEEVEDQLAELTDLLDQGGDALGLRLEVAGLRAEQEALAQDTRRLLPQTAGRAPEELTDEQRAALRELAERQRELAEQAEDLVRRMASTAEALSQQSERDADQAAAEALAEAAETARRQGLEQQMQQSAEDAQENQLSQAGEQQADALETLDRMLEQIGQQEQKRRERLQRRLRQLAERIERLIRDQQAALAQVNALAGEGAPAAAALADGLMALAEPEAALWQRIIVVQTDAEQDPATADVGPILGEAATEAAGAVAALREADADDSVRHEEATVAALERALEAVREVQQQQQEEDAERQRAQLRQAYQELAEKQETLAQETGPLATKPRLDRRELATLRQLAGRQVELGDEVAALRERVEGQVVFEHMHDRIDRLVASSAASMRAGTETARVPLEQVKIASTLRAMAGALVPPPPQNDFQDNNDGNAGGNQGGGAGGQGGEVIPPAAELKLLRAEQSMLLEETKVAAEQLGGAGVVAPGNPAVRAALEDLAGRQRELTELAERLKVDMQRRQEERGIGIEPSVRPGDGEPDGADASEGVEP